VIGDGWREFALKYVVIALLAIAAALRAQSPA